MTEMTEMQARIFGLERLGDHVWNALEEDLLGTARYDWAVHQRAMLIHLYTGRLGMPLDRSMLTANFVRQATAKEICHMCNHCYSCVYGAHGECDCGYGSRSPGYEERRYKRLLEFYERALLDQAIEESKVLLRRG